MYRHVFAVVPGKRDVLQALESASHAGYAMAVMAARVYLHLLDHFAPADLSKGEGL